MAILAVMSTIAVFSWNRYVTNANLRTATRELEADIFLIKERAVAERIHYRITLNVGANNYTIDQGGPQRGIRIIPFRRKARRHLDPATSCSTPRLRGRRSSSSPEAPWQWEQEM